MNSRSPTPEEPIDDADRRILRCWIQIRAIAAARCARFRSRRTDGFRWSRKLATCRRSTPCSGLPMALSPTRPRHSMSWPQSFGRDTQMTPSSGDGAASETTRRSASAMPRCTDSSNSSLKQLSTRWTTRRLARLAARRSMSREAGSPRAACVHQRLRSRRERRSLSLPPLADAAYSGCVPTGHDLRCLTIPSWGMQRRTQRSWDPT